MSFPRYPEYKDCGVDWLGEVPAHWDVVRLKNVISQRVTDGPHTTPIFSDDGIPFLSVDGIQNGELVFDGCRFISPEDHSEFKRKALPQRDDLLMGKAASTGKIARVKVDFEFSIWSPLALIRVTKAAALPEFVEYALKSIETQAAIDNYCTANTQKNISMDDIPRLVLTKPPLGEQRAIADFLSLETAKIDVLVAEQEKLIALLTEKRQAVISHAVTKGLDTTVPMKDSGIEWLGEVPAHWEVMPLKRDVVFLTSGSRGWADHYADDGALFIRIGNLTRDSIQLDLSDIQRVAVPDGTEGERTRVQPGDVMFSITAYLGSVAVAPSTLEPAYVSQHVALARLGGRYLMPEWVGYVSLSMVGKTYLETQGYGGTKIQLSLDDVANLLMTVPPMQDQNAIVTFLDSETTKFDALIAEAEHAIELLKERRSALISAAVTGKIDVRGWAEREAA